MRRGRKVEKRRFPLTFRSLPMESVIVRLEAAGFEVEAVQGSYDGGAWTPESAISRARNGSPRAAKPRWCRS